MWFMTTYGFYSAVCARQGSGEKHEAPDPTRMMVRVRDPKHLENLKARFPQLADCPIHESGGDYFARIFVDKAVWRTVVDALIEEVDYDNFKDAVGKKHLTSGGYKDALMSVWGVMHRVQPSRRKSASQRSWLDDLDDDPPAYRASSRLDSVLERFPNVHATPRGNAVEGRIDLASLPGDDPALIVRRYTGQKGSTMEFVCVLVDFDQYDESRVAVRDAAERGWIDPIPRSLLSVQRVRVQQARRWGLPAYSLHGVVPSVGVQVGGSMEKRVIGGGINASASPATGGNRPSPLVEDESVVGGVDEQTGAPVIRPRTPEGVADQRTEATDPSERHR